MTVRIIYFDKNLGRRARILNSNKLTDFVEENAVKIYWFAVKKYCKNDNKILSFIENTDIVRKIRLDFTSINKQPDSVILERYVKAVGKNQSIVKFVIEDFDGFSRVDVKIPRSLCTMLAAHQSLVNLGINYCTISEETAKVFGDFLAKNTTLRSLDLDCNSLSESQFIPIAAGLKFNFTLQKFSVATNLISDTGANFMAHILKHNRSLFYLNMRSNIINYSGCKSIMESLKVNNTLFELYLSVDQYLDNYIAQLFDGVYECNHTLISVLTDRIPYVTTCVKKNLHQTVSFLKKIDKEDFHEEIVTLRCIEFNKQATDKLLKILPTMTKCTTLILRNCELSSKIIDIPTLRRSERIKKQKK